MHGFRSIWLSGRWLCSLLLLSSMAAAQHVGIGNSNPAFLLDVSGRMWLRSGSTADSSAGIWLGGIQGSGEEAFLGVSKNQLVGLYGNYGAGWAFTYNTQTGTVGMGTEAATASLSLAQGSGSKIMLGRRTGFTGEYGMGISNHELRFYMPTAVNDIQFGTGTSSSFTSMLRLSDLGTLVLGPGRHDRAGLVADKKQGAVNAMFGSNTTGVAIESSFPGVGINTYFSDVRRAIGTGFGGYFGVDPVGGGMNFFVTDQSIVAGNTAPLLHAITIRPNGHVGMGTGATATQPLDVRGQMRLRGSVGAPATLQVASENGSVVGSILLDAQGIGMNDGSGNRLIRLNTSNGVLQLGQSSLPPAPSTVVVSNANSFGGVFWQRMGGLVPSFFFNKRNNAPALAAGGTPSWLSVPGAAYTLQLSQRYRVFVSGYFTAQAYDPCFLCFSRAYGAVRLFLNGQNTAPSFSIGDLSADLGSGGETTVAGIQFDLAPGTHQLQWEMFNDGWWSRMTVEYWSIQLLPIDN